VATSIMSVWLHIHTVCKSYLGWSAHQALTFTAFALLCAYVIGSVCSQTTTATPKQNFLLALPTSHQSSVTMDAACMDPETAWFAVLIQLADIDDLLDGLYDDDDLPEGDARDSFQLLQEDL
jgi:hypothetical protein